MACPIGLSRNRRVSQGLGMALAVHTPVPAFLECRGGSYGFLLPPLLPLVDGNVRFYVARLPRRRRRGQRNRPPREATRQQGVQRAGGSNLPFEGDRRTG